MIAELKQLQADMEDAAEHDFDNSGLDGYARRLEEIIDAQATTFADALRELAEDERLLREIVTKLEALVGPPK